MYKLARSFSGYQETGFWQDKPVRSTMTWHDSRLSTLSYDLKSLHNYGDYFLKKRQKHKTKQNKIWDQINSPLMRLYVLDFLTYKNGFYNLLPSL